MAQDPREASEENRHSSLFLLVFTETKRQYLGPIFRSAVAFGVREAVVVGEFDYTTVGCHGASKHLRICQCSSVEEAVDYLKAYDCLFVGLEGPQPAGEVCLLNAEADGVVRQAMTIDEFVAQERPRNVAVVVNNEAKDASLLPRQRKICHRLVKVPFHSNAAAPLRPVVLASIVLHHLAPWTGAQPHYFASSASQGKFVVPTCSKKELQMEQRGRRVAIREQERAKREHAAAEIDDLGQLFSELA